MGEQTAKQRFEVWWEDNQGLTQLSYWEMCRAAYLAADAARQAQDAAMVRVLRSRIENVDRGILGDMMLEEIDKALAAAPAGVKHE